jgi:uncharacterized alpha-E superfamily protein
MIGPQVEKNAAVDFVFMEPTFPRSVRFCIREIREELNQLANNGIPLRTIERRGASCAASRQKRWMPRCTPTSTNCRRDQ